MPALFADDTTLGSPAPRASGSSSFVHKVVPHGVLFALRRLRLLLSRPVRFPSVGMSLLSMPAEEMSPPSPPAAPAVPSPLDLALRQRMREELSRLLDRVPSARRVFPALSMVERALGSRRPDAVDLLPAVVMQEAYRQLDRLGRTGSGDVLRDLRHRLHLLSGGPAQDDDDDIGTFEPGRNVDVQDISLTRFMEVDQADGCEPNRHGSSRSLPAPRR